MVTQILGIDVGLGFHHMSYFCHHQDLELLAEVCLTVSQFEGKKIYFIHF